MSFYQLRRTQQVNVSRDRLWDFIASPRNLKEITPDYMGFDITSHDLPETMYAGLIIAYKVSPLWQIPINWMTEITHVAAPEYFVDEQRVGPYKMWHHQHFLKESEAGCLMEDIVTYQPPFGWLGGLANRWLIKPRLQDIFDYRYHAIKAKFTLDR